MRKRIIRKVKIRKWVKILITIFLVLASIQLYYDLGVIGMQDRKNVFDTIKLILGWLWIMFGQIITLLYIWE